MIVRYRYVAPYRATCRVEYLRELPVARQCPFCGRRVKPAYIVDIPLERADARLRQVDAETVAEILFTGCAPVHAACLSWWADMIARATPTGGVYPYRFRPVFREWDIHQRCYTLSRLRWYRRLIDAATQGKVQTLAQWPLPVPHQVPTARESVGMIFHRAAACYTDGMIGTVPIALRGYDAPGERCSTPVKRCSADTIARALPSIRFADRAVFGIVDGLSIRL